MVKHDPYPGMPRWLKVWGGGVAVALAAAVILMVFLGGDHGPGRHLSDGEERPADGAHESTR